MRVKNQAFWTGVMVELAMVPAAIGIGRLCRFSPTQELRFELGAVGIGLLATLPPLVFYYFAVRSQRPAFQKLREITTRLTDALFSRSALWPIYALILSLAAGLGEELLFRGLIQSGLSALVGSTGGLAVGLAGASLLFGLMHAQTKLYFVLATGIGLYLGILLILTGNLLVPITVHALYDLCALCETITRSGKGKKIEK